MFLNNICYYAVATILDSLFIAIYRILNIIFSITDFVDIHYIGRVFLMIDGSSTPLWMMGHVGGATWMYIVYVCDNRWCILALWQNASSGYGCVFIKKMFYYFILFYLFIFFYYLIIIFLFIFLFLFFYLFIYYYFFS